ncbi:type I restriction endonuclease subunit R, partial [Sulfuricurvum sp.]|uniref:type I restriction endonuclease subunit R n=1 Tax=Sulfuricurvum sp. TaxID=2025608 RepID=UPI0026212D19
VHLGLTATPKRDDNGDTYTYFGEPVYEYSLRDGINDGFLTPYKVKRIRTNIDEYRFNPDDIITGDLENQIVTLDQFEKSVVIPARTDLIAKTILEQIRPLDKTIVFCVNQSHASMMKSAIDTHKSIRDNHYCVRVTSDEGEIGRKFLEQFQDNDLTIPAILTSSKMLTTGVDAKNVRNVVLTAPIRSMTEFKQIIGRGTRVFEGKDFFTILDFVGATNLFYDPRWDGEADPIDDPSTPAEPKPPREPKDPSYKPEGEKKEKATITIRGRRLRVIDIETTYVGAEGKPLRTGEYLEYLIGILGGLYDDETRLREIWSDPRERRALLTKLEEMHIDATQLSELAAIFEAGDADIYDVLAHLSFNHEIMSRSERVIAVEHRDFIERHHSTKARDFLEFILRRYERDGVNELAEEKLSSLIQLSSIDKEELKSAFGGIAQIKEGYLELQREIYR